MNIYIAGPMTGLPKYNYDAFVAAQVAWTAAGHDPITPFDLNAIVWKRHHNRDFVPGVDRADWGEPIAHEMFSHDLSTIQRAQGVALLPGWEQSKGARTELVVALTYSKPIYDAITFRAIDLRCTVNFILG